MMSVRGQLAVAIVIVSVSLAVIGGLLLARKQSNVADSQKAIVVTRATAVADSCLTDIQQDDVVRAILLASIKQRQAREDSGKPTEDGPSADELRATWGDLMRPLGGLTPTKAELRERCAVRVDRATPP